MPFKNIEKRRASIRRHYRSHKSWYLNRNKRRRAEIAVMVADAKRKPCVDCHHSYPSCVMDLDHVRGKKLCDLSMIGNVVSSLETVKKEIEKCDAVCSNCHRIRTFLGPSAIGKSHSLRTRLSAGSSPAGPTILISTQAESEMRSRKVNGVGALIGIVAG